MVTWRAMGDPRTGPCLSLGALCLLSCSTIAGTPMPGAGNCRYVPTIEDCRAEAEPIEEDCLRNCVLRLCGEGVVICTDAIQGECSLRSGRHPTGQVSGYVPPRGQTCLNPLPEVNWCEVNSSVQCQAQAMVHELAHGCGWHHGDGLGVPANDGDFRCR